MAFLKSKLSKYLVSRLAELKTDKNSSDAYVQGQMDMIREILLLLFPDMYD